MPDLLVKTNVTKDKIPKTILQDLTTMISELLKKPEKYIGVVIQPDLWMSFGGTEEPCAICRLTSLRRFEDSELNRSYADKIMNYLYQNLGIADDRMYFELHCPEDDKMCYKADTFKHIFSQAK